MAGKDICKLGDVVFLGFNGQSECIPEVFKSPVKKRITFKWCVPLWEMAKDCFFLI